MVVNQIISPGLEPLYPHQQVAEALQSMHRQHVHELPVVAEDHFTYLGIAAEAQLVDLSPTTLIGEVALQQHKPAVSSHAHLFDVLKMYQENPLSIIPVLDETEHYVGMITRDGLLEGVGKNDECAGTRSYHTPANGHARLYAFGYRSPGRVK